MRALLVVVALLAVSAQALIEIPDNCAHKAASLTYIAGKCNQLNPVVDIASCTIVGCDGVKEGEGTAADCPSRKDMPPCDVYGKKHKDLVDSKGCFVCDYAISRRNASRPTQNERCPLLQIPKCGAGVKPNFDAKHCPTCRPSRGVQDSSSSCTQQAISNCAQRLGSSLKYCPQSAKATIDSQCCPSCKPVCQGAESPYPLESSSVKLSAHSAWKSLKQNIELFDWKNGQFAAPNGWPSVAGGNDFLKCSGGGGFQPGGGGGGNNGGGGGGGGNPPNGGGNGGGGNGGNGGNGNNGGDNSGDSDNNNGGDVPGDNGGAGQTTACTKAQTDACAARLLTLPTCAAGVQPVYDTATCCVDCSPDNNNKPAPSAEFIKQCSDDEVYQCQLRTGFCDDNVPQIGGNSMCCKSCRRREDLCTPMEVAKFYAAAPACKIPNAMHVEGLCGPTCVPKKVVCNPSCKSNQLCLAQTNGGNPICVDAYETTLVLKAAGNAYSADLLALNKDEQSFYLREVATRYCEIPQVNDECLVATKSIASLEVVKSSTMEDGAVQLVVLMKGDVNNNNPTSLLVSAMQRSFAVQGDGISVNRKIISIVRALPGESTSSAAGIIAGVAAGVVALLAVAGFFLYRRYKATGEKHTATTTHIEMATATKA